MYNIHKEKEIGIFRNIIRIGTVSSVNENDFTARVKFPDKDNLVSDSLKIIKSPCSWIPKVNDCVLCIYFPNGESDGVVIGVV